MNRKIVEQIFPGTCADVDAKICPFCKKSVSEFRNKISEREYKISGLCQKCQDSVFGID